MAYPQDCITPAAALDIANRDNLRIVGQVHLTVAKRAAYADTIDGGTLENVSEVVRSITGEYAVPAASLTRPTFIPASNACGTGGGIDQTGTTEFQFQLMNLRGRGPKVCVKTTRTGFISSYTHALNSLKQLLTRITNADIRANYFDNSGCKLVVDSTGTFAQDFAGDVNALSTAFPNRTPSATDKVTFRALEVVMTYMRETLGVEPFDMAGVQEGVFKYIGSQYSVQSLRDELHIGQDTRALITGRYPMGENTVTGYGWSGPYHGIMFGVDPEPLRGNTLTAGVLTLIEPGVATATTTGFGYRPNATWVSATYEVAFIMGKSSFARLVPTYQRIPGWDFAPQIANGGLDFKILQDADCNFWEDFGQHRYEIERAYQPVMPHAVCAILYARASTGVGWNTALTY
jgi:hypothetical protein